MNHQPAGTAALWPFMVGAAAGFLAFVWLVPSVSAGRR